MSPRTINIEQIRGKVGIGILTVRPDECDAVLKHLPPSDTVMGGKNSYAFVEVPTINGTLVGVAIARCIEQGQGMAQATARNMIDDLDPKWLLLVGIAGGKPDDEYSLGDVILASRLHDFSVSAALQDKPNQYEDMGGPMHRDVERLLTIPGLANLLAGWNTEESIGQEKPSVQVPEDIGDNRYYGSESWKRKAMESLSRNFPSGGDIRQPKCWIAPTASSSTLMKDADLFAQWLESARAVCDVEMELGGVYLAARHGGNEECRVLAIRGLSDIVGYKRDGDWTAYACNSAAAFAGALIRSGLLGTDGAGEVVEAPKNAEVMTYLAKLPVAAGDLFGRDTELGGLDQAWADPHTHILMLSAWGGVGKTSLVNHWLNRVEHDSYRGAKRVYGWSFYSQGTSEDRQASADGFVSHALQWFGDPDPSLGSPWDKGVRLAGLIKQHRTLLILDGLEPLQYPPGPMQGRLRDQGVQALLKELARAGTDWGLCVITTRLAVLELEEMKNASVKHRPLDNLSNEAGAKLLESLGVNGTDKELWDTSHEFKGHALALTLLGRYLSVVHDGEIRKRDLIPALEDEEAKGGHARRVMKSYEAWLKDKPELDILYLLGLFDRPAEGGAIEVLRQKPAIVGLTDALCGTSIAQWKYAVQHLRDLRLLDVKDNKHPDTLDCHPLVREHFGSVLKTNNPDAWKEAHSRLYEYYKALPDKLYGKHLPDTLEEMEPLFRAVAHGCHAERHQEALDEVYTPRILRGGKRNYCCAMLGAFGADLASASSFFKVQYSQPAVRLRDASRAALLSWAGYRLRALGRLHEAREPMQAGLELRVSNETWGNASIDAGNLSELCLALGDIAEAIEYARRGVEFADLSGDEFERMVIRTTLAVSLHQSDELPEAEALFREAERMQQENEKDDDFLYSLRGYQFCDLLLSEVKFAEVQERASSTIKIAQRNNWLLHIGLDYLSLGKAHLLQALHHGGEYQGRNSPSGLTLSTNALTEAASYLNQAVDGLRQAGTQHHLPRSLLARTMYYRISGDYASAWRDLQEAREIAERGGMRLHLTDYHLEAARLSLAEGEKEQASGHFATAKQMVEEMGYGRRKPEVEELEQQLSAG